MEISLHRPLIKQPKLWCIPQPGRISDEVFTWVDEKNGVAVSREVHRMWISRLQIPEVNREMVTGMCFRRRDDGEKLAFGSILDWGRSTNPDAMCAFSNQTPSATEHLSPVPRS